MTSPMTIARTTLVGLTLLVSLLGCKKPSSYHYTLKVPPDTAGFGDWKDEKFDLYADGKKIGDVDRDLRIWVPAEVWLTKSKVALRMPTTCGAADDVVLVPKVSSDVEADYRSDTPDFVDVPFTVEPAVPRYDVVIDNLDGFTPLHVTIGATAFDVPEQKVLKSIVRVGQCGWPDVTVGGQKAGPLVHAKKVTIAETGGETILIDGKGTHCYVAHDIAFTAPGEHVAGKPDTRFTAGWMHPVADVDQWFDPGALVVESKSAFTKRMVSHADCSVR